MRTFSQKQIQPQNPVSSSLARSNMATPGLAHREDPILHLQHTIGNQAAQRMSLTNAEELKPGLTGTALPRFGYDFSRIPIRPPAAGAIQTKPAINEPGDEYEQEADRVAERVMNIAVPPLTHHSMQQQPAQTEPSLQRVDQCDGFKASRRLERLPGGSQGGGSPLPDQVRIFMEPRFGFDFSQVRIHADGQAAASAEAIQARAYTAGSEIVFGGGQYSPSSGEGTKLLAHELVHVIQNASAPQASVIRRAPAVGGVPYQIISPVWNVAGRDIVAVQIKADGRIFLMYRRTGLGFKGVGNAPPRGTWAPFDGLIPIEDLVETQGGQKAARTWPYFEKNPYYDKGESEALRGYGTETNKEVTDWLNKQKVAEGERLEWREVQRELGRYKPLAPVKPAARTSSGEIPRGGGPASEASGAGKVEGAVEKVEGKLWGAEGKVGRFAGLGAKAGRFGVFLLEMSLPGPQDVLFLWISFFGSLAEAKAQLRNESYALGFAEGIAARVLGFRAGEATRMLIKPVTSRGGVGEQVAGFSGVREHGTNEGVVGGWNFAGRLAAKQREGFLKEGFATIKSKGHTIGPNFNLDDVIELGVALKPTVDTLLEIAREQEEAARQEAAAKKELEFQQAVLKYGPKD